jgi:putative metallohydrolase (TIGR04338 family)
VATNSIRDSRRQRLYDAEDVVFNKSKPPEWRSVREVQDYADFVTATDAWKALEVGNEEPISVRDGRGRRRAGAEAFSNFITMPKWSRSKWVVLHELAHIAEAYRADWDNGWPGYENENGRVVLTRTTAAHGPEYAGVYLYLVREFLSGEAHDKLLAAFEDGGVKVLPVEPRKSGSIELHVTDTDTHDGQCEQCGRSLFGDRSKFCSDECRWTYHNRLRHDLTEEGRQKVCEVCGTEFTASRADAKTCSPRCRQRLRRQRH